MAALTTIGVEQHTKESQFCNGMNAHGMNVANESLPKVQSMLEGRALFGTGKQKERSEVSGRATEATEETRLSLQSQWLLVARQPRPGTRCA